MRPLIIANWKANPQRLTDAVRLASATEKNVRGLRNVEVVVAPPFPFLERASGVIKRVGLGSQDLFWKDGPYTGEVTAHMLKNLGVRYAIIGHSERRMYARETDEMVRKKITAALEASIIPVLCVGERERAGNDIPAILGEELTASLRTISRQHVSRLVIAYEPIWSISTMPGAQPDTADNAFRVMVYIRRKLTERYGRRVADKMRIIYGGSVTEANVRSFIDDGKMGGALVGGASLVPQRFARIVKEASRANR